MRLTLFCWVFAEIAVGVLGTGCGGGAVAGQAGTGGPQSANMTAVAAHMGRTRVNDAAWGVAAAADPTGRIAGPVSAHSKKRFNEWSHEKMLDDSMRELTPQQRELMKKQMKGEISEEEFRKELFQDYGLDENGNPVKPEKSQ